MFEESAIEYVSIQLDIIYDTGNNNLPDLKIKFKRC
jgi:uncharacterized protein with HEPN domain